MRKIRFRIQIRRKVSMLLVLVLALPAVSAALALTVRHASAAPATHPLQQRATLRTRGFYVSKNLVSPDQALTTCAAGYHFASLWEIADPSNFKYNTTLGITSSDSGEGPPAAIPVFSSYLPVRGWVRTGFINSTTDIAGHANCNGWSSTNDTHSGTTINLPSTWTASPDLGVWNAVTRTCDTLQRVWCVQDEPVSVFLPIILK